MNKPAELNLDTVPCWIGGKPVVPAGRMGEVYNPAIGQVIWRVLAGRQRSRDDDEGGFTGHHGFLPN